MPVNLPLRKKRSGRSWFEDRLRPYLEKKAITKKDW
jgi:hypothetical protein